jgi:hypothetical protein
MSIPTGLFARQHLDDQARTVRDRVAQRSLVREARQHQEATAASSTQASIKLVSIEAAPSCAVRTVSAERPA